MELTKILKITPCTVIASTFRVHYKDEIAWAAQTPQRRNRDRARMLTDALIVKEQRQVCLAPLETVQLKC